MSPAARRFNSFAPQRITLRIQGHPVKLDGTITEFEPDGEHFTVEFDGLPLLPIQFFPFDERFVATRPRDEIRLQGRAAQLWEVL